MVLQFFFSSPSEKRLPWKTCSYFVVFNCQGNGPFTALSATNHGTILQELCRTDKDFISVSEEVRKIVVRFTLVNNLVIIWND